MLTSVVAGGAGFIGSHLCEALLDAGHRVIVLDDISTGDLDNIAHMERHPHFRVILHNVARPVDDTLDGIYPDFIYNLASPASPVDYAQLPFHTLLAGSHGTYNLLTYAYATGARFLLASTSEVYGDPDVHPQPEWYAGNVSSTGPRSVYDEAKRYAEAMACAFERTRGASVRIARVFNTYGPRMRANDGRVIPAFMAAALAGEPLTVFGDGSQTRSLCYVDDTVRGLRALMESDAIGPVNIGNPDEVTVGGLAAEVSALAAEVAGVQQAGVVSAPLPQDDPRRRCPDITRAREELGWEPRVARRDGLRATLEHFSRARARA